MPLDLSSLWNFSDPAESEARFLAAQAGASPDDVFILTTQVARTHGLRRDFERSRSVLEGVGSQLARVSAEARAHYWLEWGRSLSSATHPAESQTPAAKDEARTAYRKAIDEAGHAGRDDLAIDALHMLTFVDTELPDQLAWNLKALAALEASSQDAAKRWAGALHNNTGYTLHQLGRFDEALDHFERSRAAYAQAGKVYEERVARWMLSWTLRAQGKLKDALSGQLALEKEFAEAGTPDPYVFEELEALYKALGDDEKVAHYARLRSDSTKNA